MSVVYGLNELYIYIYIYTYVKEYHPLSLHPITPTSTIHHRDFGLIEIRKGFSVSIVGMLAYTNEDKA